MARRKRAVEPLPTIWNTPDDLWDNFIVPILRELDSEPCTGRPRVDQRKALDGIIYQMRSGVQWNQLPRQFGDDSSIHRTFQRWIARGVLERIWARLVETCDELKAVNWIWQSADAAMGPEGFASRKARFGGITSDRIPRIERKMGRKRAFWSMPTVDCWPPSSPVPMCRTV
jgi:putative transposase